jgi:hypothetical protein
MSKLNIKAKVEALIESSSGAVPASGPVTVDSARLRDLSELIPFLEIAEKCAEYGARAARTLEAHECWSPDTLDDLADAAVDCGLCVDSEDSMFEVSDSVGDYLVRIHSREEGE